nr:hypothetical protein [Tanacetum cinerariifolium]
KHKANAKKSKELGSKGSLASSRLSKLRTCLRWIPTGRILAMCGKLTASSNTENKSDKSVYDNAITSNPSKPSIKGFLNSTSLLDMIVVTSMIELESLFGHCSTNYSNGGNKVLSKSPAITTADASDKHQQQQDSTLSTSTLATTITADGNFDFASLEHSKLECLDDIAQDREDMNFPLFKINGKLFGNPGNTQRVSNDFSDTLIDFLIKWFYGSSWQYPKDRPTVVSQGVIRWLRFGIFVPRSSQNRRDLTRITPLDRVEVLGFPAQSIRSSNVIALDSLNLPVLIIRTSQSRQHESRNSPTAKLFDVDSGRISIHHWEYCNQFTCDAILEGYY